MDLIKGWYENIVKYFKSVGQERKRITWPTAQELKASTIIVIITLVIITSFMWICDVFLTKIFSKLSGG
jgi:preprotein translocase subunit SecE